MKKKLSKNFFIVLFVSILTILFAWYGYNVVYGLNYSSGPSLQIRAVIGDADAQINLGLQYAEQNDFQKAKRWFEKSATQGNAAASYSLGVMYELGELGEPTLKKRCLIT